MNGSTLCCTKIVEIHGFGGRTKRMGVFVCVSFCLSMLVTMFVLNDELFVWCEVFPPYLVQYRLVVALKFFYPRSDLRCITSNFSMEIQYYFNLFIFMYTYFLSFQTFFSCLVPFFFLRSCWTITASLAFRYRQMVKGVTIKFFDFGRRRAASLSVNRGAAQRQWTTS